jgi:ATP-dependent metalloprotease FtsH
MNWNFYLKADDGRFVKSIAPLDFTAVKSEAHVMTCSSDDISEEFIEEVLVDFITHVIEESDTMTWKIYIDDEDESPIATVAFTDSDLECEVHTHDMSSNVKLRRLSTNLSDYLTTISLMRATKKAFTKATAGTPLAKAVVEDVEDEQAILDEIENKTKASIVKPKETLADYVCNDTLKEELTEIVEFFSKRDVYSAAGVRIPKGVLFKGIPGTGKTYAARCIAGSVDCYFMSCTASSLQGMYVGSGAENVRGIFQGARKLFQKTGKGVIVFIDELDSFGNRDAHTGGAGSEEDRTLNQLLAEMSGFEDTDNVMVLAATNYPERLDDALMRSGRFSRQICIEAPDELERNSMVEYYYDKLNIDYDDDCSSADVAALTEGMTAADIAEIMNEAGILCIRRGDKVLTRDAVNEAINKCITKNIRRPDKSRAFHHLVAVHEAGHVLAEFMYQGTYSVKVTNYSYGDAGGFTQSQRNRNTITSREDYLNEVCILLGGRAAEEIMLHEITTGASEDFKRASRMLKAYFKTYYFETYKVAELDQLVEDRLYTMYCDCVANMSSNMHLLKALVKGIETERVLYTSDIINIIEGA